MQALPKHACLLVIDVQEGFDDPAWGQRNNPQAESNISALLAAWRETQRPVVIVQHLSRDPASPLAPSAPGARLKAVAMPRPGEVHITKHVNSAFIGTDLENLLHERGWDVLVIAGLTTPHCCSTTARMAGNLGFSTYAAGDAMAAFDLTGPDGRVVPAETVHAVELASLHGEFATVLDTAEILRCLG